MQEKLIEAYSGENARLYDVIRSGTYRWRREEEVMRELLSKLQPRKVLDCPFGTGRWIGLFDELDTDVVAIDVSSDMLSEAASKIDDARRNKYHFVLGSIFDFSEAQIGSSPNVALCIRFLNWVPWDRAQAAIGSIAGLGVSRLILGCSVIPVENRFLDRMIMRISLALRNFRKFGHPREFVHREEDLFSALDRLGYQLETKFDIFENASRKNYFYLFEFKGTGRSPA